MSEQNQSSDQIGEEGSVGEPKHTEGHSTAIIYSKEHEYMCPECGKSFDIQEAAEKHLHLVHMKHLRTAHKEFHGKDVDTMHAE